MAAGCTEDFIGHNKMAPAKETLTEMGDELDQVLLRLLDDLEALKDKRELLNGLIENGWLCLSQSRYSMGNKFVSSLQYKQDMVPSVRVRDSTSNDGVTAFHAEQITVLGDCVKKEEPQEIEEIGAADQVLRHRGHKPAAETPKPPKTEEGDGKPKRPPTDDPLRWFGVLVPQSLRQAQSTFRQGILLAAEVASLQSSIEETRRQYRSLLIKKRQLQSQSG